MEILVGRSGNQGLPITDLSVSKIHCRLEVFNSGLISLVNLSPRGTWINGVRVAKRIIVKPDDELRLGPTFKAKVKELLLEENYAAYTSYHYVINRYKSRGDLDAFLTTASQLSVSNMPDYVMPVIKSTLAYYDIKDGKLYDAQTTLYDVGDQMYDMQDGTELMQGIYASILELIGNLYVEATRFVEAKQAADAAKSIFDRIAPDKLSSTKEQREAVNILENKIAEFNN